MGVDLHQELKSSQPFVEELRSKLSYHVGTLYEEVAAYVQELLIVGGSAPPDLGAVLIVDGLEKLRGTTDNDLDVQESIEALFVSHANKLKFQSHHLICTVPTYLLFTSPGALPYDSRVLQVPVPHVRPQVPDGDGSAATSLAELREVVARRIPVDVVFGGAPICLTSWFMPLAVISAISSPWSSSWSTSSCAAPSPCHCPTTTSRRRFPTSPTTSPPSPWSRRVSCSGWPRVTAPSALRRPRCK